MRLWVSLQPRWLGGGSNTFAHNLKCWSSQFASVRWVRDLSQADVAFVIAHYADPEALKTARRRGCFILHRLDEFFEPQETGFRKEKHDRIRAINEFCHVTVYQSDFVRNNVQPVLRSPHYCVILNGADPLRFFPAPSPGAWVGHVTWGTGEKKRLDLLFDLIRNHPQERFLLIGNHHQSAIPFRQCPNVRLMGPIPRWLIPRLYRSMKALYFPSENDPCPNTAVEAILSGVPVAFHPVGGTGEIVKNCGVPLSRWEELLAHADDYRERCLHRTDLHLREMMQRYWDLIPEPIRSL